MITPELIIILLNLTVVLISYFYIYPKAAGSDINKIAMHDLIASIICLVVAGSLYWGSDINFSLILFEVNWFWFTLISYAAIETPFMLRYFKKYGVWDLVKKYRDQN